MAVDDEFRGEVVRRLFYLITVTAEDAAAIAAERQSARAEPCELQEAAERLRSAGELIEIVASAVGAIVGEHAQSSGARLG